MKFIWVNSIFDISDGCDRIIELNCIIAWYSIFSFITRKGLLIKSSWNQTHIFTLGRMVLENYIFSSLYLETMQLPDVLISIWHFVLMAFRSSSNRLWMHIWWFQNSPLPNVQIIRSSRSSQLSNAINTFEFLLL